jgi:hypothetical protein
MQGLKRFRILFVLPLLLQRQKQRKNKQKKSKELTFTRSRRTAPERRLLFVSPKQTKSKEF